MSADVEPHELFLPDEGQSTIVPVWITITREKPWKESAGRALRPDDVPDLDAIRDRWGSGVYFVQARDARKQVMLTRRYTIRGGGKPRAMDDEGEGDGDYGEILPPSGGVAPAAAPSARDDNFAMLIAMMREDKQSRREESQQFMAAERERNQAFHATMLEVLRSQTTAKIATVAQAEGSTKDAKESFQEGMEFMSVLAKEIRESKSGGGDDEDGGDEFAKTFRTIATVWAMKNLGPDGAAQIGTLLNGDAPTMPAAEAGDGG